MWANVPGLWLAASFVGLIGVAMQVRWALTRTQDRRAKTVGITRAAVVQLVGLALLVMSAQGQTLVSGLLITIGGGMFLGFIAARALQPPP